MFKLALSSFIVVLFSMASLVWIFMQRAYLGYRPDVWVIPPFLTQLISYFFGLVATFLHPLTLGWDGKISPTGVALIWIATGTLMVTLFCVLKAHPIYLKWTWLSLVLYPMFVMIVQASGINLAPPLARFAKVEFPINAAVNSRDVEALKDLLAHGIKPDIDKQLESSGGTPLMTACASQQYDAAKLLVQNGADIFAADQFGLNAGRFLQMERVSLESPAIDDVFWLLAEFRRRHFPFLKSTEGKPAIELDLEQARKVAQKEFGTEAKSRTGEIDEAKTETYPYGFVFWGRKGHEEYDSPREWYPLIVEKTTGTMFFPGDKSTYSKQKAIFEEKWSKWLAARDS